MMHRPFYDHYQPCSMHEAHEHVERELFAGAHVYAVWQLLVTVQRTYHVFDTQLDGEALARKLGVQTADEMGEFYWPRHPVVAWVGRWWRRKNRSST